MLCCGMEGSDNGSGRCSFQIRKCMKRKKWDVTKRIKNEHGFILKSLNLLWTLWCPPCFWDVASIYVPTGLLLIEICEVLHLGLWTCYPWLFLLFLPYTLEALLVIFSSLIYLLLFLFDQSFQNNILKLGALSCLYFVHFTYVIMIYGIKFTTYWTQCSLLLICTLTRRMQTRLVFNNNENLPHFICWSTQQ